MHRIMNNKGTKRQSSGLEYPDWKRVVIPPDIEELARLAVDAAFAVHVELGPGLLESAYEGCFAHEMDLRGIKHQRQLPVPLNCKGGLIEVGFRADVLLEQNLLIELKAVEELLPVHEAQVITYLRNLKLPLGLLINFNGVRIKEGLYRILNVPRIPPPSTP
jgi:iron complex transport system substrate-binding protein